MSDPLFNDPLAHFRLERHGPVIELVLTRRADLVLRLHADQPEHDVIVPAGAA